MLTENWLVRELGDADSKSGLRFWKFWPQGSFLGKFGPKKWKLLVFLENWHIWYLEDVDFYSNISFLNLQPLIHFWANLDQKGQSCSFWLKIDTQSILRMLILILSIVFWISYLKFIFWQIWAKKVSFLFCLKISIQDISRMLIVIATLVF